MARAAKKTAPPHVAPSPVEPTHVGHAVPDAPAAAASDAARSRASGAGDTRKTRRAVSTHQAKSTAPASSDEAGADATSAEEGDFVSSDFASLAGGIFPAPVAQEGESLAPVNLEVGENSHPLEDSVPCAPASHPDSSAGASLGEHSPRDRNQEFNRLFAQWQSTKNPALRDRMILMHRNLVVYLARRFVDRGEMFDDIIQQGLIGLINALDHFEPERGVRFVTFATPTILGEIRRYFRDKAWSVRVPRRMQELYQIITHKVEALTQEFNRSPTYHEIALSLDMEIDDVIEAMEVAHAIDPVSLDEQISSEEGGLVTVVDRIGSADPMLEMSNDHLVLGAALARLPAKERSVLELAYFQGFSQVEIARQMKVSQMHISRLLRRALTQLRALVEESDV